jgi:xanthine dehydrogenase small subunit
VELLNLPGKLIAAMSSSQAVSSQTLRFVLNGRVECLDKPPPTFTVLDYLRDVAGLKGTKEGCAEGDCGACTVVLGELTEDRHRIAYRAVTSCIRFLPTLDGKELVTIEDLRQPSGAAHPVQQSMIDNHASQCGFCTPGFVMSLFALYLNEKGADRERILDALSGNLCRCTGYRPIIDAGLRQWTYPSPAHWSRDESQSPARVAALQDLARDAGAAASLKFPSYHAPRSVEELADALKDRPDSLLLAGGTDIGLTVTKQLCELPALVYLGDVAELKRIEERADGLWIGAAATLTDAWPALLVRYPELEEQAARFASPPIRNSATLCGNLANGSPIGDSIPALIALGAHIELRCGARVRRVPLEDFYLAYRKTDLEAAEFVTGVAIPRAHQGRLLASYKVSKRFDQDISAVCATFCLSIDGERVRSARLAYGGLAGVARRAPQAERALTDLGWTPQGIEAAVAALDTDFNPLSDLRASATYRLRAAGNLLRRFYRQQQAGRHPALRTADAMQED